MAQCFTEPPMNPKPIFGSLQASSNESMVTAITQAQGTVFVGGYMKDPTLSPVVPATKFAFIGAYSLSTMAWSWLLIDPLTSPKTTVQSINKSGSFLLVAVQMGTSDSQFYMFYSANGMKAGQSTITLSTWLPTQNGAMLLGSSTAIFILSNGSKSMLLEIDMNKVWSAQTTTVRSARDSNNNIDMHFMTTDPLKTYIFVAHTSQQSDTVIPTTNLPAVTIEMIAALDFSTKQQFTLHSSAFGTASSVYPKVAYMTVQGGYEVNGALTVKDPTASVEQSLFRFTFSSASPFSTTSTKIKTIPCRSILSAYTQSSIFYLVDVASGTDSFMHLVTVDTGFTTITSSKVATLTSINKPLWQGSAVFVSQTLALFTTVQTKGVQRAYVYQTDATLKNHSTCASMPPVAGTLGYVTSTIFVPGTFFEFTAWSASMSYPATHTTGNQGSTGLTAIDKIQAQDIEFFQPVNLGSNFCTFATTFTVTPKLTTATEYVYQLDTGGFQYFAITPGFITSASCSDEATNLFYEITSVSPSFPAGVTYQLTNGAAPTMNIMCSKTVVPSGPYTVEVSIRLSNGQVFPRQTITLWLNSLLCEQSIAPQLSWMTQVKVLTDPDSFIKVAPVYSAITSQCTATIQLKSTVRPDGLAVAAGLFYFPNQVSQLMPVLDIAAQLKINTMTLPYSIANAALYNLEFYYKIGMKEYSVIMPFLIDDPCNVIEFSIVPEIKYAGANSFVMSAAKTVNDKFSFDVKVPAGFEFCLSDLNKQVKVTANPAFKIPAVLTSPITIEVRTTEYDQTWIENQDYPSSALIQVQLGTINYLYIPDWYVIDRCAKNFKIGSVKNRISFWGDPNTGDWLFRDIEIEPLPECFLWASYSITRVSGGTTVKPGFIVPPTGPTRAKRTEYLDSWININYSVTTIQDVGQYNVTVTYNWEKELGFNYVPGGCKQFFFFYVFVEDIVADPCEVFIKPRPDEIEQICINQLNRPNYVYPTASQLHPECKYNLQMLMKKESGPYGAVESFTPFVGATLVQANFFNSLAGKVVGDFTNFGDKTLQGVYTVKVDIQWGASLQKSATYYKIIEVLDCCGWPASMGGLAFTAPWQGTITMTGLPVVCGVAVWISTDYSNCAIRHQVIVNKNPSLPDTSYILGPHSYAQATGMLTYTLTTVVGGCPNPYDWDLEGTYTYWIDVQYVSNNKYIQFQDYGQTASFGPLTAVWIDPCKTKTIPPTSIPYMEIMLSTSGFPLINPLALDTADYGWCACSISVSVQRNALPFVHPEIFIYPGLTRADVTGRAMTSFEISPPYDLSLLGLYDVKVDYQWWRAGFSSVTFQVKFIDPCLSGVVPPYLPPTTFITGWNQIFTFSVGPNIQAVFYPYCKFSLTATFSKLQAPNTVASVIIWTNMINKSSVDLPNANLQFDTTYDPNKVGDYSVDLTYTWGTPLQTKHNLFVAKLEDECSTAFIAVNKAQTYYIGGIDTVFPITPSWTGSLSFCQVSMALSVTKNTSPNTSTSIFTWTSSITNGGQAQFDASPIAVKLNVYDLTLVGVYTFTMNLSWSNPVQSTVITFTFTVLDGCATYVIPPTASTKTRNLTDPDGTATQINVAPVMISPYSFCKFNIMGVITKTTTPDTSAAAVSWTNMVGVSSVDLPNAIVHYIAQAYTLANLGTYTVQMTYTYGGATFNDQSVVQTWTLNIIDPCLAALVPPTPPNYTKYVTDPDIVVNLAPTINAVYQAYCTYSISMSCAKTETPNTCTNIYSGFTPQVNVYYTAIPTQTQTLVISPETYENIGTYTFSVIYNWGGTGNTTTVTKTFTLLLKNPCSDIGTGGVLSYPARTNLVVKLLDPNTVLDVTPSISSAYQFCSASVEMTRTKDGAADTTTLLNTWVDKVGVAIITIQGLKLTFTHNTYDLSLVGVYSIVLKYTAYGQLATSLPFTFTVVDPCIAAVVPPSPATQTKWLSNADYTQNYFPTITAAYQPYCLFSLTMTITKSTSPDTTAFVQSYTNQVDILYSQNAQTIITFMPSSHDLTHVGTYTLTWKYEWGGTGHVQTLNKVQTYQINNPCLITTTGKMSIPTRTNLTGNLVDPNTVLNVKPTMTTTGFEWCLMTITATVTKSGAPIADGFVTWTDQTNLAVSALTGTQFTFNTSGYVPAYIGVYTIALTYTWSDPTPITRTFTFTVGDPCATAVVPPASIPNKTLYIGNLDFAQTLAPTITAAYQAYCVFSISLTSVKTTTPDTSATAITFTALVNAMQPQLSQAKVDYLSSIQNLANVGVYNLAATYTWGGAGAINSAGPKNFVLTLQDPCLAFTTIPTLTTNYVKLLADPNTSLLAAPTMTTPGYEWCTCSITLTLTKNAVANNDGFVTWTNAVAQPISNLTTKTILFNTSVYNGLYLGVYSVSLLYNWSTASTSTQAFTFTVNDPCPPAIIPPSPLTIPNYGPVNIGDASFVQTLAPTVALPQQPYCVYSISMVATKQTTPDTSATAISFTQQINVLYSSVANSVIKYNVATQNTSHAGIYDITITWTWGGTGANFSASHSFTLTLVDPCLSNMIIPTFSSKTAYLSDPDSSFSVTPTMSIAGYEWCPVNIVLTLTKGGSPNSDGFVTWTDKMNASVTSLAAAVILFNTSTYISTYIGVYDVSLQFSWSTATPVVQTFTFTVLDPCPIAITPPASIPNYTAMIGTADYTQTLEPTISLPMQPHCYFTITMVSTKTPLPDTTSTAVAFGPVVDVKQATIAAAKVVYKCSVQDLTHKGTYNIEMTYTWAFAPVMTTTLSFVLTLQDPCLAYMTMPTFTNKVALLVDPDTSLLVTPTMSTAGFDWCLVSIAVTVSKGGSPNSDGFVGWSDVTTLPLSSLTTKTILFNTSIYVPAYVGVYTIQLLYSWSLASTSTKTFTFTVNDPCIATIVPPASISPYTAYIGDPNFLQTIAPTVDPTYQAYCVFSIYVTSVKRTSPDTSATAMTFTDMVNALYSALPNAKISYNVSVPDLTHTGVYDLSILYTWGGAGAVSSTTLTTTLTLQDPCVAFMTVPTFTSTTKTLLDSPNTSFLVTPTITPPNSNYMHCQVSITLTLTKSGLPNADGFVTWTDVVTQPLLGLATKNILFNHDVYVTAYVGVYSVNLKYDWSGPTTLTRSFTFTVVDPCILNNVPPATLPNYTAFVGNPDYVQNIAITVGVPYQVQCLYSITLTSVKTTSPDTSATALTFTNMVNKYYTDLPNAKINYNVSVPDLAQVGVYNLSVLYQWGGYGQVMSTTLTMVLTLQDPCLSFMVIPTYPSPTALLVDPNTSFLVTPTIVPANPNYMFCKVSITMTLTKGGLANADGFVTFTNVVTLPLSSITTNNILFNTVGYEPNYVGVYSVDLFYQWSVAATSNQLFTFTVVDPCILNNVPPASIPNYSEYMGQPDFTQDVAIAVGAAYQDYCKYSIILTSVKVVAPETSATAMTFINMLNALYTDLGNAKIVYRISVPQMTHIGLYNLSVLYQWGGNGTVMSSTVTFTLEIKDPCGAFILPPSFSQTTATLVDPNTTWSVVPTVPDPAYEFCEVSITMTLKKGGISNADGFVTFTDVVVQHLYDIPTASITFKTVLYNPDYVGTYSIDLKYDWTGPTSQTQSFTFTVVDPCILNNVPPATLPNYTAFVGDPDYVQNIAITVGVPYQVYCLYSITLTSVKTTSPDTSATALTFTNMANKFYTDLPNAKINYNVSVPDLAQVGVYNLSVLYQWGGYGLVMSTTLTMVLTLQDPCLAFMVIPTYPSPTALLLDPNTTWLLKPTIVPSNPTYDFCWVSIFLILNKGGVPNSDGFVAFLPITNAHLYDIQTNVITFNTNAYMPSYVGVYQLDLFYQWSGPSTSIQSFTFTVIDPCILNNVPPVTLPNYSAYIGDPDYLQDIAINVNTAYQDYCLYSIQLTKLKRTLPDTSLTAITYANIVNQYYQVLPSAKIQYNVSMPNLAHAGVYDLTVLYQWGGVGNVASSTVPFTLTLLDPCKVFMVIPTYVNMVGTLLDVPNYTALVTPTISSPNYLFCTVSIQMAVTKATLPNSDGFAAFSTIVDQQLAVIANSFVTFHTDLYVEQYIGVYSISLTFTWSGPTTSTQLFTFTVIDPCIAAVVPPASIPNTAWWIGDPDQSQSFPPTIDPVFQAYCIYSISIAVTKDIAPDTSTVVVAFNPMVNANYLNNPDATAYFDVSTQDLNNTGIYTIVVTYQWGGFGSDTSLTRTFTMELKDPCKNFLTPPTFSAMLGYLLDPNQTALVTPTISPNYMFCTVTIVMTVTKNAAVDASPFAQFTTITNQPLSAIGSNSITFNIDAYIYSYVGVYTVSLAYSWSGPSTSTQVFTFEVIDPCIREVTPPVIPDTTIEFKPDPLSVSYVTIQPSIQAMYAPYCFFDVAVTQALDGNPFPADTFVLFADMVQAGFLTNPLIQIGLVDGYYDISLFGVWTVNVQYSWNGPTTQTKTFIITYVPPPDPCFLAIAPPLSIASLTNWLSDPNFGVDVNPTIDPVHPECLFDISMAVTKNPTLYDTAADVLTFPAKLGASLSDLPTFVVSHWPQLLVPQNRGVYTIGITYKWFTQVTRTYVWTLNDPCPVAISTPLSFANQSLQLNKLDSTLDVSAFISQPQFMVCLHSVNVAVQKAGASVNTLPNNGNPIEFNQVNSMDFFVAGVNLITYKTDSTVTYNPSFQGLYDVFVQYRWAEDGYPAPIVVDLTFQVQIIDPCQTELTTPLSFPDMVVTYGDQPNLTLDISVTISSNNFDFCAYNLLVDSSQVGSFNKATLIQFNNINWSTVLNSPTAVLTFATFSTFWDPASSGTFTITLGYSWSLSNQNIVSFQLDVINHCFQTTIDSYLIRDMMVAVGQGFDVQAVPQVTDAVGKAFGPLSTCGLRVYSIVPSNYKFLNFTESQDQMVLNSLSLGTDLDADQGKYLFQLKTSLASFPAVPSASTIFTAFILRRPVNHKPTFVKPLDSLITIQMLNFTDFDKPIPWFYNLPDAEDLDNDVVSMSINWWGAESFISLTGNNTINIKDIREDELNPFKPGYYPLFITLSDNKESNSYMLPILSLPANPNSTSAQFEFIDESTFFEMQKQMNKRAFLTWLASLVVRKVICKYEEYLMSFIEEDDPLDWAYRVLNETGNFTDYALFGWRPGVFWENMTEQEYMDEVRDEVIDWRTAVAVQRTFDREMMPTGWLKDKNPPKAYFRLMTDTGKVRIGFTENVYIVPDMRMVNNGTIYMSELQMLGDYKRQLIWQKKADQYPVIQLEVLPGEGQDQKMLNFTWNATMQDYDYLDIQVYFDYPEVVSTGYQPDKLRVRFNDPMLFLGVNGHVIDKSTRVIEKQFRRQAARNIKVEHEVWQTTKTIAQVAMISNIVLNIFISAALNQMWSMIETQQLIILLLLFEVQLPANAMAFFSQLMAIAAFDFVNVEPWTNWLFQLNSTGALTDRFDQIGMGSIYFMNNLGSFGIIFLVYLILLVCLPCLGLKCCRKIPLIYYNKKAIRNRFKWGYLISTIRESSAIIAMCVFINLKAIKWEFVGDWFHNLIAIIFLLMITVFPAYCFWYIYMNWRIVEREGIERKRLMARFGIWIDDLKVSKGRVVLWQPVFFIFRRLQLAVACVFVRWFIFQTFMVMFQIIFSIIMVGYVKPWDNPSSWKYQVGNEILLLLVYYHLMCFTPFFPDMEKQWWLGYSVVVLVAGHLVWSILYIIFIQVKALHFEIRLWFHLRDMRHSNIKRKELFAEHKFLRRKRRAEFEKKMKLMPICDLFEEIEEKKQQDKKEKKARKKLPQLSAIVEEDEAADSNRRQLALVDNQAPVNGIFAAKQYRNPILDLFDEPASKFDLRQEENRHERSKKRGISPSKSKESPRKRRASPKKGSLNDLFELGKQLDEKYNSDTFANDNLQFQKPKPFADGPTRNDYHRTSHQLQEQLRLDSLQQEFGIVNASHLRKPTDNGWLIEGQRSTPLSDVKKREFKQFEFDHLPDLDERSAISATNLNREQDLRRASSDDVLQDIRAFGSISQLNHQSQNGASIVGGFPRRHISDLGIPEPSDKPRAKPKKI